MRIDNVEVANFCQYESKTIDFHPGLNCVVGPNGVGKSNLMNAILGGITGNFPKIDGTRVENIRYGSSGPSYVCVNFEHKGVKLIARRDFRPSSHQLLVGTTEYRKEMEVREALVNLLGVSLEVVSDFVFVQQGKMDEFIVSGNLDRLSGLQELFGLTAAEKLWKSLGNSFEPIIPPSVDTESVKQRIELNKQLLAKVVAKLATIPNNLAQAATKARNDAMLAVQRKGAAALAKVATTELDNAQYDLVIAITAAKERKERMELLLPSMLEAEKMLASINVFYQEWVTYNNAITRQKIVEGQYHEARRAVDAYKEVPKPDWYIQDTPMQDLEISKCESELSKWKSIVEATEGGCKPCPTCLTPVGSMLFDLKEKAAWVDKYIPVVAAYRTRYKQSREWDGKDQQRADSLKVAIARLQQIQQEMKVIFIPAKPLYSHDDLDKMTKSCNEKLSKYRSAELLYQAALNRITEGEAEVAKRKLALASCAPDAEPPTDEDIDALKKLADDLSSKSTESVRLNIDKESLTKLISDDQKLLDSMGPVFVKAKLAEGYNDHIERVRSVLHRNALPASAAKRGLQIVESHVNALLQSFEAGFQVTVDDRLTFVATLKNGYIQPAYRLSGGQRVLLSLAFRVAIGEIFASDLRLLCLDEPTVWLDDRSMRCLETAFRYLRQVSAATGLQVIMITHERSLDHLFDKVISLV